MTEAKTHFRAQYHQWFGPEIGELALAAGFGGANGATCPDQIQRLATAADDEYVAACGAATCPVCNFCFKYHHPEGRHGEAADL